MISSLNGMGRLLDLLGKAICYMFQVPLICVVDVALLMLHILKKSTSKAFEMLGKLNILGKAGKMLGKLAGKVEDAALQRIADNSVNAGTSFYSLGSDMQSLERDLMALKGKASDTKEKVEIDVRSGRKRIKREVENWLKNVEQLENEFNKFKRELQAERSWNWKLLFRLAVVSIMKDRLSSLLFSGAVVSGMKDRLSSLTVQSHNFGDLLLDVVENRQNNN